MSRTEENEQKVEQSPPWQRLPQKALKAWVKAYKEQEFDCEVIGNYLQPYFQENSVAVQTYCRYWVDLDPKDKPELRLLPILLASYGAKALKATFGRADFQFKGNRLYHNWVLGFEGNCFVVPEKRSIAIMPKSTPKGEELNALLLRFERAWTEMVLNYIERPDVLETLSVHEKRAFNAVKEAQWFVNGEFLGHLKSAGVGTKKNAVIEGLSEGVEEAIKEGLGEQKPKQNKP